MSFEKVSHRSSFVEFHWDSDRSLSIWYTRMLRKIHQDKMTPVELLATTEKKIYLFTRETMLFGKHTLIYIKNEFQLTKFDFRNSKSKEYK